MITVKVFGGDPKTQHGEAAPFVALTLRLGMWLLMGAGLHGTSGCDRAPSATAPAKGGDPRPGWVASAVLPENPADAAQPGAPVTPEPNPPDSDTNRIIVEPTEENLPEPLVSLELDFAFEAPVIAKNSKTQPPGAWTPPRMWAEVTHDVDAAFLLVFVSRSDVNYTVAVHTAADLAGEGVKRRHLFSEGWDVPREVAMMASLYAVVTRRPVPTSVVEGARFTCGPTPSHSEACSFLKGLVKELPLQVACCVPDQKRAMLLPDGRRLEAIHQDAARPGAVALTTKFNPPLP